MSDLYYDPDKFGLETIGEIDLEEPHWSFDMFAVWRDRATGEFLWASDSGCSCPSPFDSTGIDDLTRGNFAQLAAALNAVSNEYCAGQVVDLIGRARRIANTTRRESEAS